LLKVEMVRKKKEMAYIKGNADFVGSINICETF
jgi:hypothetical protein